jgi:hypothetical protein
MLKKMVWYDKSQNSRQVVNSAMAHYIMIRRITSLFFWWSWGHMNVGWWHPRGYVSQWESSGYLRHFLLDVSCGNTRQNLHLTCKDLVHPLLKKIHLSCRLKIQLLILLSPDRLGNSSFSICWLQFLIFCLAQIDLWNT